MRQCVFHWFCLAAGILLLGIPLSAQSGIAAGTKKDNDTDKTSPANTRSGQTHLSYVQDWSSRHLLLPGTRIEDVLAAGTLDPRQVYNLKRGQLALKNSNPSGAPLAVDAPSKSKIDWAVSLENGYVAQDESPAKFGFDIDTENCQSDYVLFGLNVTTSIFTQANLVGINNLYTSLTPTPCNGGAPWVSFAYNTQTQPGGQIFSSPTLSADGTMVAFVESTTTGSYFHVLVLPYPIPTPGASPSHLGTVLSPVTPTTCLKPNAQSCMTTLAISGSDSISSPWIDYASDTAYVGDDNGILYKITPVFRGGKPALVNDPSNWPVTVSTSAIPLLTDPIVDNNSGRIFLGDLDGFLYAVSLASPGNTYAARMNVGQPGYAGAGLINPPIVVNDPANPAVDQVFAFTGCSNLPNVGGAVTQVPANFTSSTLTTSANTVSLTTAKTGQGTCIGGINGIPTSGNVHSGTFDNNFFLNGSGTSTPGHLIACGFISTGGNANRPRMYMLSFVNHVIASSTFPNLGPDNTGGDECSALTEFFDGTTDRVFFGVGNAYTADRTPDGFLEAAGIKKAGFTPPTCTGTPTSSCVTTPSALGGVSGIVVDNDIVDGGTNIYFTTLAPGSVNGGKCNVTGGVANPYCAVKLTQAGLQ
jgi:hypothetical protein